MEWIPIKKKSWDALNDFYKEELSVAGFAQTLAQKSLELQDVTNINPRKVSQFSLSTKTL